MDELVRWFGEQLDEIELLARAACWDEQSAVWTARPPRASYERYIIADYLDDGVVVVTPENADADGVGRHVEAWDPARALREVDTDRALIADYVSAQEIVDAVAHPDMYDVGRAQGLEDALRRRASAYGQRSGYREEWRP